MIELTAEECKELEKRVANRFSSDFSQLSASLTARIVITTIREYERMKQEANTQKEYDAPPPIHDSSLPSESE